MSDGPADSASSRFPLADTLLLVIVLFASLHLLKSIVRPESYPLGLIQSWAKHDSPLLLHQWNMTDPVTREAFGHDGNIAAIFSGLNPQIKADKEAAQFFYYRSTYLMWPRRMFVANEQTPIRNGVELLAVKAPQDPTWLQSHGVQRIVRLQREGGRLIVQPVKP